MLMERILSRENLLSALKRVESNKGSHGVDEMPVQNLRKKPGTKVRKLIGLGAPKEKAYEWGNSRKSYWRISKSPILHRTLGNSYWSSQGLKSLLSRHKTLRYSS